MKRNFIIVLLMAVAMLVSNSCEKKGCTVPYAMNNTSSATKDDGSCWYYATHVIFYGQNVANYFVQNGIDEIVVTATHTTGKVYHTAAYWSMTANENDPIHCIVLHSDILHQPLQSAYVTITDRYGNYIHSFDFTYDASEVTQTQLYLN